MFYSQFILAKKGPLGTIWIAAHLERKLRKNQVADTDIGVSVDSILFPEVPIALRLSSHLLLGVVRIYSRKVNYLFDDCSEALLKVKQAFRSTAVDLPPEETTAPYHSITLPETFDLDDFELPDNDIFQGNYVDHHVSTREQITLQDTMEGVVYSTSQFGLDERFADGDTSQVGLELEEDLFLHKVATTVLDEVSEAHPQVSIEQMTDPERHLSHDMMAGSSDAVPVSGTRNKIEGLHGNSELLDYAEAPSTPGLVEEPNFFSVQKGLASEDHLGSEDHNSMEVLGVESIENVCSKSDIHHANDAKDLPLNSNLNGDTFTCLPPKEISHLSGQLEMSHSMLQRNLSSTVVTMECVIADGNTAAIDGSRKAENMYNGGLGNDEPSLPTDKMKGEPGKSIGFRLNETDEVEVADNKKELHSLRKSVQSNDVLSSELSGTCDVEVQACQQMNDDETLNHHTDNEQLISAHVGVLWTCNSHVKQAKGSSHEVNDHMFSSSLQSEDKVPLPFECFKKKAALHSSGTSTKVQGEELHRTDGIELEENQILMPSMHGEVQVDGANLDGQQDNATTSASPFEKLDGSVTSDFSAPEKLLSVPQMLPDKPDGLLIESTPEKEVPEGSSGGSLGTVISGKKRSFTESSLSVQSFNEVESYGVTRSKITTGSVPDDDDLLSSILVGRKSSVLKMKLTPTAPEIASTKRVRVSSGHGSLKRKVLMDDSMVLHGDTIRQQLTNTEDIRRLRKKAPCTLAEILMIQRQFLEQDIFSEMLFTGVPAELACLHGESFDLSRIVVSEHDEHDTALGMEKDEECYARPFFTKDCEIKGITVSVNDGNDFDMQFAEVPAASENQHGDHELGSYDVEKQGHTNIISDLSEHRISECEHLGKISSMEIDGGNAEVVDVPNHSAVGFDPSQTEPFSGDNSNTLTNKLHEPIDGIGDMDNYPDNKIADETVLEGNKASESIGIEADVLLDGSTPAANANTFLAKASSETGRCMDTTSVKVDQVPDDIKNDKVRVGNECGGPARSSGFDDKDQTSNYLCSELAKPVDEDYEKEFLNDGAYPVCREADQQNTMDTENSLDHPAKDFQDVIFANDTEFLNVDDEVGEDDEDGMPRAENSHFLENSGWSSRTRAVAKYLQTLFDGETGHGRKVLSMDNLVAGKTRKEASRMFFETLVLNTRDYLHVEQAKPFDTINIKPRGKLMRSDF